MHAPSLALVLLPLPPRRPHLGATLNFPAVSFSGFESRIFVSSVALASDVRFDQALRCSVDVDKFFEFRRVNHFPVLQLAMAGDLLLRCLNEQATKDGSMARNRFECTHAFETSVLCRGSVTPTDRRRS
jgi:hypothetical protein